MSDEVKSVVAVCATISFIALCIAAYHITVVIVSKTP